MKISHIIICLTAALFLAGCATKDSDSSSASANSSSEEAASGTGMNDGATQKTAYEGSTGSGLLMERYKAGSIEGYRDKE